MAMAGGRANEWLGLALALGGMMEIIIIITLFVVVVVIPVTASG